MQTHDRTPAAQPAVALPLAPAFGATAPSAGPTLVIGCGSVRAAAALGFVEVLAEHGMAPSRIVGCSAGAMFGALLAAGHSARSAMALAARLWTPEVATRASRGRWRRLLAPRWFGFDELFALRDDRLVVARLEEAFGDLTFADLALPLAVSATDLRSGEMVVLREGRVLDAVRASIALPVLFRPWRVGTRLLVDGALSDPLPVGVAVADGARTIVALGFESPAPARVDRPEALVAQISRIATNSLMEARLAAARTAGAQVIEVFPAFDRRVAPFDAAQIPYLVDEGRRAAAAMLPRLTRALHRDRDDTVRMRRVA